MRCSAPSPRRCSGRLGARVFFVLALAPLTAAIWLTAQAPRIIGGGVYVETYSWIPSLGVDLTLRMGVVQWVLAMIVSLGLLGLAMKSLPVGTSYAVWVGVGAVGTAILGIVLLGEPASTGRLVSLGLIVAGIVGLKLSSPV